MWVKKRANTTYIIYNSYHKNGRSDGRSLVDRLLWVKIVITTIKLSHKWAIRMWQHLTQFRRLFNITNKLAYCTHASYNMFTLCNTYFIHFNCRLQKWDRKTLCIQKYAGGNNFFASVSMKRQWNVLWHLNRANSPSSDELHKRRPASGSEN